jgi:hypothetical protein
MSEKTESKPVNLELSDVQTIKAQLTEWPALAAWLDQFVGFNLEVTKVLSEEMQGGWKPWFKAAAGRKFRLKNKAKALWSEFETQFTRAYSHEPPDSKCLLAFVIAERSAPVDLIQRLRARFPALSLPLNMKIQRSSRRK